MVTQLAAGQVDAREAVWPDIYDELHRLAQAYMGRGRQPQMTLQPTALVHEAFLRLVDHQSLDAAGKTHFFAIAANAMRYVLADYARRRNAEKRGGKADRMTMHSGLGDDSGEPIDAIALDEVLTKLEAKDARAYRIVELRFLAGLTIEQTADMLDISPGTVKNEWRWARVWLLDQLSESNSSSTASDSDPSHDVDA
jgi:RNA polymerase sigma factor (TIGR02999 family)